MCPAGNDGFQANRAAVAEHCVELAEHDGADVFDSGDTGARCEGFGRQMHIDHGSGARPLRVEWQRGEVERVTIGVAGFCQRVH